MQQTALTAVAGDAHEYLYSSRSCLHQLQWGDLWAGTQAVTSHLVLQFVRGFLKLTDRLCLEQVHSLSRSQTPELYCAER